MISGKFVDTYCSLPKQSGNEYPACVCWRANLKPETCNLKPDHPTPPYSKYSHNNAESFLRCCGNILSKVEWDDQVSGYKFQVSG